MCYCNSLHDDQIRQSLSFLLPETVDQLLSILGPMVTASTGLQPFFLSSNNELSVLVFEQKMTNEKKFSLPRTKLKKCKN
jgi:hypothetical protein